MPATQLYVVARHTLLFNGIKYAAGATVGPIADASSFTALVMSGSADDTLKGVATIGQLPKGLNTNSRQEGGNGDSLPVQRLIRGF